MEQALQIPTIRLKYKQTLTFLVSGSSSFRIFILHLNSFKTKLLPVVLLTCSMFLGSSGFQSVVIKTDIFVSIAVSITVALTVFIKLSSVDDTKRLIICLLFQTASVRFNSQFIRSSHLWFHNQMHNTSGQLDGKFPLTSKQKHEITRFFSKTAQ